MKLRLHQVTDDNLIKLLHEGKIQQFNERRSELKISRPDFTDAKLAGADLSKADLRDAKLSKADLRETNLSNANLSSARLRETNLSNAVLQETNLLKANLSYAKLAGANLSNADLRNAKLTANLRDTNLSSARLLKANLSYADLSYTNLSSADLSGANMRNSIILEVEYLGGLICDNADFKDAIIDDAELSEYLENHNAKNISPAVKDKEELKKKLGERVFSKEYIDEILNKSTLT